MLVVSLPGDVRQTAKEARVRCAHARHRLQAARPRAGGAERSTDHAETAAATSWPRARACIFTPKARGRRTASCNASIAARFELAVELQQEILPVVLCDTNTALPRDAYWFEPYHATVTALPRMTPQNFDYAQGSTALMRHCETIVRDSLQQQLDAINTPRVVRRKVNRLYRYLGKIS